MCCSGFLKVMMFIFNGIIFLAGAVILGLGIWVTVDSGSFLGIIDKVENIPSELYQIVYVGYLLIGVGAVLVIIGFLGCCGAVKESRCMLLTFFSIVLIIFLVEVAGAVVLFVFQGVAGDLLDSLEERLTQEIKDNYGKDEGVTSVWNTTMQHFACCGYRNYTNFDDSPFFNSLGVYPSECCEEGSVCFEQNAKDAKKVGCYDKLLALVEENAVIIAAVALGIAALEIAAMVVSMILYNNIGRKHRA